MLVDCPAPSIKEFRGQSILYLGGEDWEHGIAAPQNLAAPPECEICSGEDDARVDHSAAHIWPCLLSDLHRHHATIQDDQIVDLA